MENNVQETKLCKHCQTEIPKKAKVCPNCRKSQDGKLKWVIIAIVSLFIIGLIFGGDDEDDAAISKNDNKSDISSENEIENAETGVENNDTKEDGDTEVGEDSNDTKEDENIIAVGDSFEKDGLKITVNEASTDFQDYDNEYGWNTPKDGMKYVMVSFTFENNGDSDAYVSIYDFDCYADNTTCEQQYGLDDNDFVNANLSPKRNVSFKTYYAVPVDSESIELEYETNAWTSEKVIIKVQ